MTSLQTPVRDINRTVLQNGVRVISEPMSHLRSISIGVWIGTGARRETAAQNGISHFIEHMLFKGTSHRTAEEIAKIVDSTGGHLDAYTSKELVSYNTKIIDDHLPIAYDVLADLVLNPLFEPGDIDKEKGVILEELKMEVDNPEYLVHETFFSKFWKNNPLGRSILGTKKTINAFTRDAVEAYYRSVYLPGNIVITAAGRLDHQRIVDFAEQYFGSMETGPEPDPEPVPVPQVPLVLKNKRSLEQLHLCMGVPAYSISDERRYVCYVLSTLLGGGMSSRLFQNIREKHGLAYAVFSELNVYRDSGCLAVYAGTSQDNLKRVAGMVVDEFRSLYRDGVPPEELRRAKDHLKGSLALGLESTSSRMSNLARQELFFGRFYTVDEMVATIEKVSAEEVQSLARDLFEGKQIGLTALGRTNGTEITAEELVC